MPAFTDPNDFMLKSTILRKHGSARVFFDPDNKDHTASLKVFIETGNWGGVQFYPEFPYIDVPQTVLMKFAAHQLKAADRTEFLKTRATTKVEATPATDGLGYLPPQ